MKCKHVKFTRMIVPPGMNITEAFREAIETALQEKRDVEFDFNGKRYTLSLKEGKVS